MIDCNMTLDEFKKFAYLNDFYGEYLVKLRYKHDYETEYTESSQIVTIDFYGFDKFLWLYDWCEGETDVSVLGYIKISDMENTIESYKKANQELKESLEKAIETIRTQEMLNSLDMRQ